MPSPAFATVPEYDHTNGDIAAEMGELVGLPPDDQQQMILDAIYAEDEAGEPAAFEVAAVAPRQNLKTAALEVAALTDLFVFGEELIIWSAHLFPTARKSFLHMVQLIESCDDLRRQCHKPRSANGSEMIQLLTGQAIEFHARSKGGGRGMTGSKVVLDEALFLVPSELGALLPTMATMPGGQVRYGTSAGLLMSEFMRSLRKRGRIGDAGLAWLEWCAPFVPCEQQECPHLPVGVIKGCALDNRDLWRIANPAYNVRITERMLAKFRRSMPPDEFMREFLGWWEDPPGEADTVIDLGLWDRLKDGSKDFPLEPIAFGVTVSPDNRSRSAIGAAGRRQDGRVQVDLIAEGRGTAWVVDWISQRVQRWGPVAVVLDGTAKVFEQALLDRGIPAVTTASTDRSQATVAFYDALGAEQIRHPGEILLDQAVARAEKKPMGGTGWVWDGVSVSPLVAVTLAYHGLVINGAVKPPAPPPVVVRAPGRGASVTADLASINF